MRPTGEISTALLGAAEKLVHEVNGQRRGATLRELAQDACVGMLAARSTVRDLRRHGKLEQVGERKVDYRNRPVAEYAPKQKDAPDDEPFFDVASVFATWVQG